MVVGGRCQAIGNSRHGPADGRKEDALNKAAAGELVRRPAACCAAGVDYHSGGLDMERQPEPGAAEAATDVTFPVGWFLDIRSWEAHRSFYRQWGRPMEPGEYSHLLRQIRHRTGTRLSGDAWRLTLPDGAEIVVSGKGYRLFRILRSDWTPPPRATTRPAAVEPAA